MILGADDAGKRRQIYQDPAMQAAFEEMGFEFLMHHIQGAPRLADLEGLIGWADKTGHDFILNQENTSRPQGPDGPYRKGGYFFQPPAGYIEKALTSRHFMGLCYDEAEHWATNGVWITGGGAGQGFQPHFYNAEGDTLQQAYEGNLFNLQALMRTHYPTFAHSGAGGPGRPIITTEHVFPIFFHLFARAGIHPIPKYMKETVTPVHAAMALGAAKEYGTDYWACLDLWGISSGFPGHSVEELRSALLFAYWTGASRSYIENINYRNSLYQVVDDAPKLTPHGELAKWWQKEYAPAHPRTIRVEDFSPEIIIVRFEDSDWGQQLRSYIRENLYGASNLKPDEQTRYWCRIWHVISHGTIPISGLTWHAGYEIPFRFFFPANNVAVYDHLADRPELYSSARLVFLTGKLAAPSTLKCLEGLVQRGLVVVTPTHLAPAGLTLPEGAAMKEYPRGEGKWVITNDVTAPEVRAAMKPFLGKETDLRYVFGRQEVVFTAPKGNDKLEVEVRALVKPR